MVIECPKGCANPTFSLLEELNEIVPAVLDMDGAIVTPEAVVPKQLLKCRGCGKVFKA